jgi:hypothetical protein
MTATHFGNANLWKEEASKRERSARLMTLLSIVLGFALLTTFSYGYASSSRYSGLCAQIHDYSAKGGKNVREAASTLAANYCS